MSITLHGLATKIRTFCGKSDTNHSIIYLSRSLKNNAGGVYNHHTALLIHPLMQLTTNKYDPAANCQMKVTESQENCMIKQMEWRNMAS